MQFQYFQIIHALTQHWKESINQFVGNLNNLYIQDHHLINCHTIYNQKLIYKVPRIAMYDVKNCIFQFKLINNVLYLNKKLFHFGIIFQPKCSICELHDETPQHLFYECICKQHLRNHLQLYISGKSCITSFNSTECHPQLY